MGRWAFVTAATIAVTLVGVRPATACDCHDGGPVCQAFWTTPVVFAGRVVAVWPDPDSRERRHVRFTVTEAFKGTRAKVIELIAGNTSCDLWFNVGEEWLIYAFEWSSGTLSTGTCSRSQALADAADDLAYLRTAPTLRRDRGRIIGELIYVEQTRARPAAGLRVMAEDASHHVVSAITDAEGRFEIDAATGKHHITVKDARGMTLESGEVTLVDARGCVDWSTAIGNSGSITGVLHDARGAPLHDVAVAILPAAGYYQPRDDQRAITDAAGRFDVDGLMPGDYFVAVAAGSRAADGQRERMVYAGGETPQRFRVDHAAQTRIGVFRLPEAQPVVYIDGLVIRGGRPAPGVTVALKADVDGDPFRWTTIVTDQFGRFRFGVIKGARYRIVAAATRRIVVDTSEPVGELRLTVE